MKEGLIYDNGKLRRCPYNKAKIGWLKTAKEFYSYKQSATNLAGIVKDFLSDLAGVLVCGLTIPLLVVLFPVMPFIHGYVDYRKSKREVSDEIKRKIDNLHT